MNVGNNLSSSYQAIIYNKFGPPTKVLAITNLPLVKPKPGKILVKMLASSINQSDLLTIKGTYSGRIAFPKVLGFEGVGIVVDIGDQQNNFLLGKRVLAIRGIGTWQEYNLIPAENIILVPERIDNNTAAQLYINPLTVWLMLKLELKVTKRKVILVNAGNSICGHIIAGFTKLLGSELISIVRRAEAKAALQLMGIKNIIDSSSEDLITSISKLTDDQGVDYALDAVSGDISMQMIQAVKPEGKFIQYGLMSGEQLADEFFNLGKSKAVIFKYFHLRDWVYNKNITNRQNVIEEMIEIL